MKIRRNYKLTFATTVFLMTASQLNLAQAADYPDSSQAAPPAYNPSYQGYPPLASQDYGSTDNLTPGYTQPNYGGRNYRRGSSSPWGGRGPGFSGPWDGGRGGSMPWDSGRGGSSMPWDSGRGGSGPSFSGPWDSGRGNSMPWDSGRGGSGPGFSGPWDSGRGNSMPW